MATRKAAVLPYQVIPIKDYLQIVEAPGGPVTLHVRHWDARQANRCRLCRDCKAVGTEPGRAACVVPWAGRLTAGEVSALEGTFAGAGEGFRRVVREDG